MTAQALPKEILDELRAEYLAAMPDIIKNIEEMYEQKNWSALEKVFHKLTGSGKTYGLPDITDIARAIETYFQKYNPPSEDLIGESIQVFKEIISAYIIQSTIDSKKKDSHIRKIS